jgi:hypothetical protein
MKVSKSLSRQDEVDVDRLYEQQEQSPTRVDLPPQPNEDTPGNEDGGRRGLQCMDAKADHVVSRYASSLSRSAKKRQTRMSVQGSKGALDEDMCAMDMINVISMHAKQRIREVLVLSLTHSLHALNGEVASVSIKNTPATIPTDRERHREQEPRANQQNTGTASSNARAESLAINIQSLLGSHLCPPPCNALYLGAVHFHLLDKFLTKIVSKAN